MGPGSCLRAVVRFSASVTAQHGDARGNQKGSLPFVGMKLWGAPFCGLGGCLLKINQQ